MFHSSRRQDQTLLESKQADVNFETEGYRPCQPCHPGAASTTKLSSDLAGTCATALLPHCTAA